MTTLGHRQDTEKADVVSIIAHDEIMQVHTAHMLLATSELAQPCYPARAGKRARDGCVGVPDPRVPRHRVESAAPHQPLHVAPLRVAAQDALGAQGETPRESFSSPSASPSFLVPWCITPFLYAQVLTPAELQVVRDPPVVCFVTRGEEVEESSDPKDALPLFARKVRYRHVEKF